MTSYMGPRAVYLRAILVRGSVTAMGSTLTVSVHDDLMPCGPCVFVRTTNDKLARRADQQTILLYCKEIRALRIVLLRAGEEVASYIRCYLFLYLQVGRMLRLARVVDRLNRLIVLCAQDDHVNAHGVVIPIILYRHLTLSVKS